MATKKQNASEANPTQIKQTQQELYHARVKNTLKSLENVTTIRKAKKLIAQQKTILTAK